MYAITPNGIGKQVGARKIRSGWVLTPEETFTVDTYAKGDVLGADGVSLEPAANEIPPTDEERIDAAFPQTDVARVLFEVIWQFSNEIEALKTGVVFNPATPIFTRAQVKNRLKSMLP